MTSCRRSEEHTSELQSRRDLVCRLLLEKKKHHRHRRPGPANPPAEAGQVELLVGEGELIATRYPHQDAVRAGLDRLQRFFFNDTATTEIYTLSLHDALPI